MLSEDIEAVENLIWKYINELPNQLLNYVPTKITQQEIFHLPYNSNIIASDNVYRCTRHLYCKCVPKEIV